MSSGPPLIAVDDIARLVGPTASARGQEYSRRGAVADVEWNAASGSLSGRVAGSGARPYRCRVTLVAARPGYLQPVGSGCDCPVSADCKHAAALMFESNRQHVQRLAGAPKPASTPDASDEGPSWRAALAPAVSADAVEQTPELGLLFELRRLSGRTRHRWQAPTAATATTPLDATADYRLAVRPVLRSATGNWVRANIGWNSLSYQQQRLGLDLSQHRWFTQFGALQRSTREMFGAQEAEWLYLDDFDSPLLWQLLDEAARLGIAFVSGKKNIDVRVAGEARLSLDVTEDGGALRVDTVLRVDGDPVATAGARAIGAHGVYVAALHPRAAFVLAPTATPLTEDHRRMLSRGSVRIPAADVDEFLADFYPRLGRSIPVTSASVDLPELRPPELVLTADFEKDRMLRLEWSWLYDGVYRPLDPAADDPGLRDLAFEATLLGRVADVAGRTPAPASLRGIDAAEFCVEVLPALQSMPSVRIEVVGEPPDYRELTDAPHLTVTATESDRRDWFDLGVIVTVDGKSVPFAPLFAALTKGRKKLLLVDNSYLSLDHPAFDELKRLIDEASELGEWETGVRISRYRADLWAEFEDLADESVAAQSWRDAARGLLDATSIPHTPVPDGVRAELRPYQRDGFDWLAFLHAHGLGGILADDMGLGKTLQALALMAHSRGAGTSNAPFLVVAPTSVVSNWVTEAARYTPGLAVRGITATEGKARRAVRDAAEGADVVITSYALFRLDFDAYQAQEWSGLVLDEAQFVKNPASKAHRCAVEFDAPVKFALTGTPLENSLIDLWALFAVVAPGLFPSKRRFTEEYVFPITQTDLPDEAAARTARLRRRIRPLMMRRTKQLVATELPAKQEQNLHVDLDRRHRALYDTFLQRERQKLLGLVEDLDRNRFIVFRSLTLLRMLSLDAALIDEQYADIPSAKLDALLEHLDDVAAEGHRALVFSQFTSFLKRAAARLDAAGIAYEYLDGSTLRRAAVIERFRSGDAPVFLISLKAGGFGLNLTEADYVFLLDPWWNPATESQAVDRTHRIGQTKPVNVYRLVASGTIEEKVMALRDSKAALFDAVMEDDAVFSSALTADDIRGLLDG